MLVTGITGQDGGYLAERLVADGLVVHGTVHPGEPVPVHLQSLSGDVTLHAVDLRDGVGLERLLSDVVPDEVVNLAGISSVAASWESPVLTADVNALGVARLLELLWRQQQETNRPVRFL